MTEKEHICKRMIQVIEGKGLVVTNFEEKWKEQGKISVGYLAAAAKKNRNVGIQLIEYFLEEFPDTDVEWLITGRHVSRNTEKNGTSVPQLDYLKEKAEAEKNKILLEKTEKENDRLWALLERMGKKPKGGKGKARISDN